VEAIARRAADHDDALVAPVIRVDADDGERDAPTLGPERDVRSHADAIPVRERLAHDDGHSRLERGPDVAGVALAELERLAPPRVERDGGEADPRAALLDLDVAVCAHPRDARHSGEARDEGRVERRVRPARDDAR